MEHLADLLKKNRYHLAVVLLLGLASAVCVVLLAGRIAVTDSLGKFLFAVVPIGRYSVNVKLPRFCSEVMAAHVPLAASTISTDTVPV